MDEAMSAFDVLLYCKSYERRNYEALNTRTVYMPLGYCDETHRPLAVFLAGCAAQRAHKGTVIDSQLAGSIQAGVDNKASVEKLLGRWTVVSAGDQCALNLTQTQKTGTGRFRASAPACALKGLSAVSSWALAGTQVQLFDEGGNIIGAMILSGNRFIGTLAGGQGISMVG